MNRFRLAVFTACFVLATGTRADVFRWDNGQTIPGTEGIHTGPGVQLDHRELEFADLAWMNLGGANLAGANLTEANLSLATLRNTNLTGALIEGADFSTWKDGGIAKQARWCARTDDLPGPWGRFKNVSRC